MKRYICFLFFLIGLIVCNKTHSFNEDHTSSRLAGAAVPAIYFVLPIAKIGVTELFAHIAVPTVVATIIDFFAKYIKRKKAFVFNGSELKSPMPMLDPEKNDDEDEPVFVANMKQFFEKTQFGRDIYSSVEKTKKIQQGQSVYRVTRDISRYGLKKGDYLYLDAFHKNHLEVFDSSGTAVAVISLKGNIITSKIPFIKGRTIS